MGPPQRKGHGSSICTVLSWEGGTAVAAAGCSKDPPSADCLWSPDQNPGSCSCGLKVTASCMRISYRGAGWPSAEPHLHASGPLLPCRSHSQVPEPASLPCPPPERGSVQAVSGGSRAAWPAPGAPRRLADWTCSLAQDGGTCICFHRCTFFLEKDRDR